MNAPKKKALLATLRAAGYAVTGAIAYATAVEMADALTRAQSGEYAAEAARCWGNVRVPFPGARPTQHRRVPCEPLPRETAAMKKAEPGDPQPVAPQLPDPPPVIVIATSGMKAPDAAPESPLAALKRQLATIGTREPEKPEPAPPSLAELRARLAALA